MERIGEKLIFIFTIFSLFFFCLHQESQAGNNARGAFSLWPDTGQDKCYDNEKEITCPAEGQPFYGQDAQYSGLDRSYSKLDDQGNVIQETSAIFSMVQDNVTGLIWEIKNNLDGVVDYSNPRDADNTYAWCDRNPETNNGDEGFCYGEHTEYFISQLNESNFGGHNDWRIPTVKELLTLSNRGKSNPSIDTVFAETMKSPFFFWTATSRTNVIGYAWVVEFLNGRGANGGSKYDHIFVRAVRGGTYLDENHFIDNGDGTVTDTSTCLQWQKETMDADGDGSPDLMDWQQALASAENLSLAQKTDWRLPDQNELLSLVDHGLDNPAISSFFPGSTKPSIYYSSTSRVNMNNLGWHDDFLDGDDYYSGKINKRYVRAVRNKQCQPITKNRVSVFPENGPQGTTFSQSGTGFTPNGTVILHLKFRACSQQRKNSSNSLKYCFLT